MAPFNHFNVIAPAYDKLIKRTSASPLAGLIEPPVEGRLLDAGGGTGRASMGLVGLAGSITIADSSIRMLRQAQTKPGLQAVAASVEALPFAAGCFSRVLMVDTFHHVADQETCLKELWRVLSSRGRLIIEEPDIRYVAAKAIWLFEKLLLMRSRFWPAGEIATLLRRLGADVHITEQGQTVWIVGIRPGGASPTPRKDLAPAVA